MEDGNDQIQTDFDLENRIAQIKDAYIDRDPYSDNAPSLRKLCAEFDVNLEMIQRLAVSQNWDLLRYKYKRELSNEIQRNDELAIESKARTVASMLDSILRKHVETSEESALLIDNMLLQKIQKMSEQDLEDIPLNVLIQLKRLELESKKVTFGQLNNLLTIINNLKRKEEKATDEDATSEVLTRLQIGASAEVIDMIENDKKVHEVLQSEQVPEAERNELFSKLDKK